METLILIIFLGLFGSYGWTTKNERGPEHVKFREARKPEALPDGTLKGVPPPFYRGSWWGKSITAAESRGINLFEWSGIKSENYPFVMYFTKGLRDTDLDVVRFDYDLPANPWWLRFAKDEVREIAPGQFIGKIYFTIIPGSPTLIGYFGMNKE